MSHNRNDDRDFLNFVIQHPDARLDIAQLEELVEQLRGRDSVAAENFDKTFARIDPPKSSQPIWLTHLVLQGGGTLGFAHVGFLFGLELVGIRAAGVAGTSAGSIVALGIAASRKTVLEPASRHLVPILASMPVSTFVDGPPPIRRLLRRLVAKRRLSPLTLASQSLYAVLRLLQRHGLNNGDAFENWLSGVLAQKFQVLTLPHLARKLGRIQRELTRFDTTWSGRWDDLLQLIATAMPVGIKFTFPRDRKLVHRRYRSESPAFMARASMSIPLFFEPMRVELEPFNWRCRVRDLAERGIVTDETATQYQSENHVDFVDGGLLSNFPMDAFIRHTGRPSAALSERIPTIGVALVTSKLRDWSGARGRPLALGRFGWSLVTAARHQRDKEAHELAANMTNSQGRRIARAVFVDVGDHNWLDFGLDEFDMRRLFCCGLRAASRFLKKVATGG